MQIQNWPIEKPVPYARNARVIPQSAIDKVAASLQEFGFRQPLVVDENGVVVVGHTRLQAAKQLGMGEVPVHVATGLTKAQVKAYRLMDNRSHEEAGWDNDLLKLELEELNELDFSLDLTGFGREEISDLLDERFTAKGKTDEDETPPLPESAVTRIGDVWILGEHRIMCADCMDAANVAIACGGVKPAMLFTDPPYGINLLGAKPSKCGGGGKVYQPIKGDSEQFDPTFMLEAYSEIPMFLWGANYFAHLLPRGKWFVWDKERPKGLDFSDCELAWSNLDGVKIKKYTVNANTETSDRHHPTQKPVRLYREILDDLNAGAVVLDLFLGSGTAVLACETTGRRCIGLELDEHYCDVIVERWQNFTGRQAMLADTGRTFKETSHDRQA